MYSAACPTHTTHALINRFFILVSAPATATANASKNHFRIPPPATSAGGPVGRAGSLGARRDCTLARLLAVYGGKRKPRILSILRESNINAAPVG